MASNVIILDFETTGLSPNMGDRAIEIGAVRLEQGRVVDRFQALMNPGKKISSFIENYTGISNAMLADAAPCADVMRDFSDFIGDYNLVAHNAAFDRKFLDAELARISRSYRGGFGCSLLASRRVFLDASAYSLSSLVDYTGSPSDGQFHRALYDAEMTAKVWLTLLDTLKQRYQLSDIAFETIQKLNKTAKKNVDTMMAKLALSGAK